jgi:hypothetical protein
MSEENYVDPLDRRWPIERQPDSYVPTDVSYALLEESPDRIECWTKITNKRSDKTFQVFTFTAVNSKYVEKAVGWKWDPRMNALAEEKIAGRNEVSFKHVTGDRTETNLVYYGNVLISRMVRVTNVQAAKETLPKLMCDTAEEELKDTIPLDDTYEPEKIREGYESTQLENVYLKEIMEDEMESMFHHRGYVFAEDGKSFLMRCIECDNLPCVWIENKDTMILFDEATHDKNTQANKHRHAMYRQMALVINDGPSGAGVRMRLPECVLAGVRDLFPDPDNTYTGHRDAV